MPPRSKFEQHWMIALILSCLSSTAANAAGVSELTGAWGVDSTYPGRTAAVYSVSANGRVKVELPRIPDDAPTSLMNGGTITKTKTGYLFRAGTIQGKNIFDIYASAFASKADGILTTGFKQLAKDGVPFTVEGKGANRKIIWQIDPNLGSWFPGNRSLTPGAFAQIKKAQSEERRDLESFPWKIKTVKPCANAALSTTTPDASSSELFEKFFRPDTTLRFRRTLSKPPVKTAEFSSGPAATVSTFGPYPDRTLDLFWPNEGIVHQLKLYDQGNVAGAPKGTRRFQSNVAGKRCMEVIAEQDRSTASPSSTETGASSKQAN